jgi:hypothetical protein
MNFFTVSGEAATRVSPLAASLRTAIFVTSGDDQNDKQGRNPGKDGSPFENGDKARIAVLRCVHILFLGHDFLRIMGRFTVA